MEGKVKYSWKSCLTYSFSVIRPLKHNAQCGFYYGKELWHKSQRIRTDYNDECFHAYDSLIMKVDCRDFTISYTINSKKLGLAFPKFNELLSPHHALASSNSRSSMTAPKYYVVISIKEKGGTVRITKATVETNTPSQIPQETEVEEDVDHFLSTFPHLDDLVQLENDEFPFLLSLPKLQRLRRLRERKKENSFFAPNENENENEIVEMESDDDEWMTTLEEIDELEAGDDENEDVDVFGWDDADDAISGGWGAWAANNNAGNSSSNRFGSNLFGDDDDEHIPWSTNATVASSANNSNNNIHSTGINEDDSWGSWGRMEARFKEKDELEKVEKEKWEAMFRGGNSSKEKEEKSSIFENRSTGNKVGVFLDKNEVLGNLKYQLKMKKMQFEKQTIEMDTFRKELKEKELSNQNLRDELRDTRKQLSVRKGERHAISNMKKILFFFVPPTLDGQKNPFCREYFTPLEREREKKNFFRMSVTDLQRLEKELVESKHKVQTLIGDKFEKMYECNICMDRPKDRVIIPCGHFICSFCLEKVDNCPVCRGEIEKSITLT